MRRALHTRLVLPAVLLFVTAASASAAERTDLLVTQGQVAYRAGRTAEARDRFAAAVAGDPNDAAAQYGLGLALAKLGRWDEAQPPLERATALRRDFPSARRALGLVDFRLGEAALARGDHDRAVGLFEKAAELDPADADRARYLAGVARARAGQPDQARTDFEAVRRSNDKNVGTAATDYLDRLGEGGGAPSKRWGVRGLAGIQYDSNPALESHDDHRHRDQAVFLLGAHGNYDVVQREDALLRLDYDFYQSLMPDFTDFDFRGHQLATTGSYALQPWLWAGVQGGWNHYSLGPRSYLQEPFVTPFVTFTEGKRGRTQLLYRYSYDDYLSSPFNGVRDGKTQLGGINQLLLFSGGTRYITVGWQFEHEQTNARRSDYTRDSNEVYGGVGFPAWWKTAVELLYLYRNDDYANPNSFTGFTKTRNDDDHRFYAGVKRNLTEHLDVTLAYRGTANRSNIGLFDYRRSVASLFFEVTY